MKKFSHREIKHLIKRFEELKRIEKDFNIRTHYNEIAFHLRSARYYIHGGSCYTVKEQIERGWING